MMQLVPIKQSIEENKEFLTEPGCGETLYMTIDYYKRIGFYPPWIGYLAKINDKFVGAAGYKGRPVNNRIEIAYGTFPDFRMQGIGTEICKQLVGLALRTDPLVTITARTLPEKNFSTKILEKNGFKLLGIVWDKEDGDVWEWEYIRTRRIE
jgi:RimJ/RimL family protein N-acetyltransferase